MKRLVVIFSFMAAFAAESIAARLEVEMVMPKSTWYGELVGRDGDLLKFKRRNSARAILLGADTIKEVKFKVNFNEQKLIDLLDERNYEKVISLLEAGLKPYELYSDVPSNLTPYKFKLMQVYMWAKDYEKSLELARKIGEDDSNPELQKSALIFAAISLIEAGKVNEAEALMDEIENSGAMVSEPARLYTRAKILSLQGKAEEALETVAKVIAFYSQDPDWMSPSEFLCAELYAELGQYDSANEVINEILILYKNTPEFDKAKQLKLRIDGLRAEDKIRTLATESE